MGARDNVHKLVKRASDYHNLSAEERNKLVTAFDEEKEIARDRPPNLSVKTRNAECSNSFKAIVDEVEALKQQIGMEALVVLVRGTCDLNIEPKVHFTSSAIEQYLRTATWKHAMEFACKLEGYIISGVIEQNGLSLTHKECVKKAKQIIRSGMQAGLLGITGHSEANFEYLRYEHVVQKFLVKVVRWTHSDWANPSDLKGGIEALETLADAIKQKTCKFVTITHEEANKHLECIAAGESLTPNIDKDTSLSGGISAEPSQMASQMPIQQSPTISAMTATTSATTTATMSSPTTATTSATTSATMSATMSATTSATTSSPNVIRFASAESTTSTPPPVTNETNNLQPPMANSTPPMPDTLPPASSNVPSMQIPDTHIDPHLLNYVPTPNLINPTPELIFSTPNLTLPSTIHSASLSDPSGVQDTSALTAVTNHKRCAPATLEEPRSKHLKKPSAKALAAEMDNGGQKGKKSKEGRAGKKASGPKSTAYVDSKNENDHTDT
ncbi:uncharacterized protein HD556DRAFT_1306298 [Suillus plorans]|uniref:Uncharacterized protein n=1 Tax=Suillus plorans TaxID=116603 RepID=A0A9P7DM96_9AGAM|nr:uncharacterized protein HD556DRAFT_1306298 [Suillus plorans]KAG1798274.1 hypothetical protein HD556DRAFT_1306298 [Suillus plorans]